MAQTSQHITVEDLAEEYLNRRRHGERPTIAEYLAQYPDLADEIQACFPALQMVEDCKPASESAEEQFQVADSDAHLQQLGDFRIVREVGRGGMGVVYDAEQVSLGRRVALKVLPRQLLASDKQCKRFEREAKAAARLHHTNIVPVFGVGEQEGLHYYVMQFIHGQGWMRSSSNCGTSANRAVRAGPRRSREFLNRTTGLLRKQQRPPRLWPSRIRC